MSEMNCLCSHCGAKDHWGWQHDNFGKLRAALSAQSNELKVLREERDQALKDHPITWACRADRDHWRAIMDKYDAITQAINAEGMVSGRPMTAFHLERVAQALRQSAADAFREAGEADCEYDQVHADWCFARAAALRAHGGDSILAKGEK